MTRWMSAFAAGVGSVTAAGAGGTKGVASGGGAAVGGVTVGGGATHGVAVGTARGLGGGAGASTLGGAGGVVEGVGRLEVLLSRNRVFLSLQEALRLRREAARRREVRCAACAPLRRLLRLERGTARRGGLVAEVAGQSGRQPGPPGGAGGE